MRAALVERGDHERRPHQNEHRAYPECEEAAAVVRAWDPEGVVQNPADDAQPDQHREHTKQGLRDAHDQTEEAQPDTTIWGGSKRAPKIEPVERC